MSERNFVEVPFMDQLKALDWKVIDQGIGIPTDPSISLRTSFKEVILPEVFKTCLNKINQTEQQQSWLTDKQIHDLMDDILNQPLARIS
jgi:type I restriction enzyme R subunit